VSTAKQRARADKKRLHAQARRSHLDALRLASSDRGSAREWSVATSAAQSLSEVRAIITTAVGAAIAHDDLSDIVERSVDALLDWEVQLTTQHDASQPEWAQARPSRVLSARLAQRCAELWASGWQPVDVAHVIRHHAKAKLVRLLALVIGAEASVVHADMPHWWADQLRALDVVAAEPSVVDVVVDSWQRCERLDIVSVLHDAVMLLGALEGLRPIAELNTPPARWSLVAHQQATSVAPSSVECGQASDKTMSTIRALLAKAEATTFAAEAEAFAAKAQEMMARYAIDAAMLDASGGGRLADGVRSRRFHLDHPYAKEKLTLLSTVASVNRVRCVYDGRYSMCTAVGFPEDLTVTDLLFTSLLVQATRSLNGASQGSRGSSPAFRRGFWIAYAVRIGERLSEAEQQAEQHATVQYGSALVPLLAARNEAVDERVNELFSNLTTMKTRRIDADGWYAGRSAADGASLDSPLAPLSRARN
jgi:hypothetical protein